MRSVKRLLIITFLVMILNFSVYGVYVESNKDTKRPPETAVIVPLNTEGYTEIQQNENFIYYYKKHNGILAVYDKRNGYTWKSGIDHDYDQFIEQTVELYIENNPNATDEEILAVAKPIEDQMNNTREGIANSLILIEYLNRENVTRPPVQAGSSAKAFITAPDLNNPGFESVQERVSNSVNTDVLAIVNNDPNHYRLKFQFKVIDVEITVQIYFDLDGFNIEIRDEDITGEDVDIISSIALTPFMGSYGGKQFKPRVESTNVGTEAEPVIEKEVIWDIAEQKLRNPGYMFVPDGSGALLRFTDYATSLSGYTGHVYGQDIAQMSSHISNTTSYVPFKQPVIPVFGISYGDGTQAAFLSYVSKGSEFMQIYARPSNSADTYNLTDYNIIHSRFVLNKVYTQVYNQSGASYQSLLEERNRFDIYQHYNFLAGDGSNALNPYSADYVGMALKYRDYLSSNEVAVLDFNKPYKADIPIRVDFLMSDAKNALVGTENVVTTDIWQVKVILDKLRENGITNINSGLLGYQNGGVTLGRKSHPDFIRSIGTKDDFKRVVGELNDLDIDVSLAQDYTTIFEENLFLIGNAMKHVGGWYSELNYRRVTGPVEKQYYATPWRVQEWVTGTQNETAGMGFNSYTYDGITNNLYSHYDTNTNIVTVTDTIALYQETFERMPDELVINNVKPNLYLWKYTDRYLQAPVFSTQFLVETDTVPFLQILLNGSMEVYAPYSNFSFYQIRDVLRMIDYNTYPSFVLTHDPSYELVATQSADFYSTEYTLYEDMIKEIYTKVNSVLAGVQNTVWINRSVLAPGVILNTYENGIKILINYTDESYVHGGVTVLPLDIKILV